MYGDVLEADLQRYFHVDICDVWRGTLSLRKVRVLIEALPADSRAARAIAGVEGELVHWSLSDALLGRLADELAALRWQWESAHLPKGQRPRKQPVSVLPTKRAGALSARPESTDADVIPLVSPHKLGGFINDDMEAPHGD